MSLIIQGFLSPDSIATQGFSSDLAPPSLGESLIVQGFGLGELIVSQGFVGGSAPPPPKPPIPNDDILSLSLYSIESVIGNTSPFTASTAIVSLFPEPYPIAGSPLCFLTPGEFREIEGQNTGGGRYVSGFIGIIFTHVVVRNLEDVVYQARQGLLDSSNANGILPVVDSLVDAVQVEFLRDQDGNLITQEPLRLVNQSEVKYYDRAGEWAGIRLAWEVRLTLGLTLPEFHTVNPITVKASNLSSILIGIQNLLINSGVFTSTNCLIGLIEESFPVSGSPFAVLTPGGYNEIEGQVSGGGRYVSGQHGTFTAHVIVRNRMDMVYQDESFLMNDDPTSGVFAMIGQVINSLHFNFIIDSSSNMTTEEPIRLVGIGQPRRYGKDAGWGGIKLTFQVKYQYKLNVP